MLLQVADDGLQLALLLLPAQSSRRRILKADRRVDRADLRVVLGLAQGRATVGVTLDRGERLQPALPLRRALDVRDELPHLLERRVDLGG